MVVICVKKIPTSPHLNTKLCVVFVLPALVTGGAEKVLINLMNGLNRARFSSVLITVSGEGTLHDLIDRDIPVHCLGQERVGRGLFSLYAKLRALKPDIIVSTMAHMNFAVLLLKPFFPKTRFIVREATLPTFILKSRHGAAKLLLLLLYRFLYPTANKVISPAQIIIDEFRDRVGVKIDNHTILRNPLDLNEIDVDEDGVRAISDTRPEDLHFLCVGRLDYLKGYDRLIAALPDLEMEKSWHLDILGEGTEHAHLENLIQKNALTDHVTLVGLVKKPWAYYTVCDYLLLPSRCEGLPNVVLEALACGTKVIATKESGGIHEIAARAEEGAVTIVDTMQDFIKAMQDVKPLRQQKQKKSLLPVGFEKTSVMKQFEEILLARSSRSNFYTMQ